MKTFQEFKNENINEKNNFFVNDKNVYDIIKNDDVLAELWINVLQTLDKYNVELWKNLDKKKLYVVGTTKNINVIITRIIKNRSKGYIIETYKITPSNIDDYRENINDINFKLLEFSRESTGNTKTYYYNGDEIADAIKTFDNTLMFNLMLR